MLNSYRIQAERRAGVSRHYVPAARTAVKAPPPLLELPPWGYGGGGRHVLSMPVTMINSTQRLFRPRVRSASPAKQTNSACETQSAAVFTGHGLEIAGPAIWSTPTTYGREGEELGVAVELKSAESSAENNTPKQISENTATVVMPAQDAYSPGGDHSVDDTVVTGGGPVTSSSMETWTTSSSPRLQSLVSSPHNLASTLNQNNTSSSMPTSPPHSPTSWSQQLSPMTTATSLDVTLTADLADRKTDATNSIITPTSRPSGSKSTPSTVQTTANELVTLVAPVVPPTPLNSSDNLHEQKTVAPSAKDSSACEEVTVDTPASMNSSNDGKGSALRRVSSRTDPSKSSPSATSKANDQDKSSLMVGLVKVKSRHTGLMIDCPILETMYQNEAVESSSTAARQSSSHKVVLIKAVVPRWAWNGRGQFSRDSSSPASPSSAKSSVDSRVNKRKSSVSVNTQTSDTLLSLRRTSSEHQTSPSATPVVDTHMYVPALQDECQLIPSPKLSACFGRCKSNLSTPIECNVRSPIALSHVPTVPNSTNWPSSAPCQSKKLMSAEIPNLPTSPLLHGYVPMTLENPNELGSMERPSPSMEYDSLMEDTIENLKLDLQFSSSGNNSDNESVVTHDKVVAKRSSAEPCNRSLSSSTDDMQSSVQGLPTLNWSCAATAATASSDGIVDFKTSGYVDEMTVRTEPLPSPLHQKPTSTGRSSRTPTSQRRSPPSKLDNCRSRADNSARRTNNTKCQSSPKNSQRTDARARMSPESYPRPQRSPCPWRSLASNDVEQEGWMMERDLSCQDPHQYQHEQLYQSQQHTSSTTQYVSRSESSLSDGSKSTNHDCYEMTTKTTPPTMSPRSAHTGLSSTVLPSQLVTSAGSETCATESLDATNMQHHNHRHHNPQHQHHHHHHHHHRATSDFRSNAAGAGVKSTDHQSRHDHRRSTSGKTDRAREPKSPTQEQYKVSTSSTKRSSDRQRKSSREATRRGEVAQSSQSTGSMTAPRHARSPTTATRRQHSSSASRHMPRNSSANKRTVADDVHAADRRASASRQQHSSVGDIQRRTHAHTAKYSALEPASRRRSDKQTTSPGRRQRHGNASVSKSVDSVSRDRARPQSAHANYCTEQPNNCPPRRHDDHQSDAIFYDCRQPIVYCSPRSLKPFPPPISDRYPPSCFVNSDPAAVGTSLDAETFQYVMLNDCGDDEAGARNDYPPPPVPASVLQERVYGRAQTGADHSDHPRRANAATLNAAGRRRKKLPATPVFDGQGWGAESDVSVHIAVPSVIERPAWRQY